MEFSDEYSKQSLRVFFEENLGENPTEILLILVYESLTESLMESFQKFLNKVLKQFLNEFPNLRRISKEILLRIPGGENLGKIREKNLLNRPLRNSQWSSRKNIRNNLR